MQQDKKQTTTAVITAFVFSAGIFFYLWLRVDPSLHYLLQEPDFRYGGRFFSAYCGYPGGVVDYCASFLSPFCVYPAVCAFVISVLLFLITLATYGLLRPVNLLISLIPAGLLVMLHSNYDHTLSIAIGLAAALSAAVAYRHMKTERAVVRLSVFLLTGVPLYYCAAGNFLLYAALCALVEIFYFRRKALGWSYVLLAAVIPCIAQRCFFLIPMPQAYLGLLPFTVKGYAPQTAPYLLYAFFPAVIAGLLFVKNGFKIKPLWTTLTAGAAGVLLVALLTAAVFVSYNRVNRVTLSVCRMTRQEAWNDVLAAVKKSAVYNVYTTCAIGQALHYKGLLPTDLFTFRQHYGAAGLFLFFEESSPEKGHDPLMYPFRSDLFFRLGLISGAEQWGYESVAVRGESPWTLRRLAQVHAVKGEKAMARLCLSILETMPLQRTWAADFRKRVDNPDRSKELQQTLRRRMPDRDFIVQSVDRPYLDLEQLVIQRPDNAMAYEYLMASYLLNGDLQKVASLAQKSRGGFAYLGIPRTYQEALAVYSAIDPAAAAACTGLINRSTTDDFNVFNALMEQYAGDPAAKIKKLGVRYGNTYWYYYLYALQERLKK